MITSKHTTKHGTVVCYMYVYMCEISSKNVVYEYQIHIDTRYVWILQFNSCTNFSYNSVKVITYMYGFSIHPQTQYV